MKIFTAMILVASFTGCVSKVMVLQTPVISMTKSNAGSAKTLTDGKPIEEKWCSSEEPVHPNSDGSKHYGMIDQVVWRAHNTTKSDYFTDNRFYQQGECMWMSANTAQ